MNKNDPTNYYGKDYNPSYIKLPFDFDCDFKPIEDKEKEYQRVLDLNNKVKYARKRSNIS
jgi:hypothetical protein